MATGWTTQDIPDQSGRRAVVTGATGGLGFETALALAGAGAEVILAARNARKGAQAVQRLLAAHPRAAVRFEVLDLASLASVADFAARLGHEGRPLGLLVNNAAVMALPTRQTTADGFEMQFGVNYLGHFALTLRLLPLLRQAEAARVVHLSSLAHKRATMHFDDLQLRRYSPWGAYAQSKLAMLLFAFEMQRRSATQGWGVTSNAAHPGWAATDIIANGPVAQGGQGAWKYRIARLIWPLLAQSAAAGALPVLYAATAPEAQGGAYYGPQNRPETKGPPGPARLASAATDTAAAARLWQESERLVGLQAAADA